MTHTAAPVQRRTRLEDALVRHWSAWLGVSAADLSHLGGEPGGPGPAVVRVVGTATRERPGWDGQVYPVAGVVDPAGNAVVALPVGAAGALRGVGFGDVDDLRGRLPALLGSPDAIAWRSVYRWAVDVPGADRLPDAGVWVPAEDPRVPEWLRPFGGEVLVAFDGDRYLAGVGLKRHDAYGHELAVGTDEAARGRGLARRLVAQAARGLRSRGLVATYQHAADNLPSARVADAAGFPDRGWTALGLG